MKHYHRSWLRKIYLKFCSSRGLMPILPVQNLFKVSALLDKQWLSKFMKLWDLNTECAHEWDKKEDDSPYSRGHGIVGYYCKCKKCGYEAEFEKDCT